MRIGIDIDNVISNFDDTLLKEYLKHDKELRNTGIINENPEYLRKGMFDWTEEEVSCPNIKDDTSYELTEDNHKITVVNYLNVDKIYKDLFEKLRKN